MILSNLQDFVAREYILCSMTRQIRKKYVRWNSMYATERQRSRQFLIRHSFRLSVWRWKNKWKWERKSSCHVLVWFLRRSLILKNCSNAPQSRNWQPIYSVRLKNNGKQVHRFFFGIARMNRKNSTVQCQLRCGYIIIKIIVDGTHPNWGECSRHTPHLRWYWNWLRQFRLIMMRESGTLIPSTTTKAAVVSFCTHACTNRPHLVMVQG